VIEGAPEGRRYARRFLPPENVPLRPRELAPAPHPELRLVPCVRNTHLTSSIA
jgi:hypothetical protein